MKLRSVYPHQPSQRRRRGISPHCDLAGDSWRAGYRAGRQSLIPPEGARQDRCCGQGSGGAATTAKDVGTTVTGIQATITFDTLVMASLMITGGKVGQILGRKRAFAIGCVIYGCGPLITALSLNPAVLLVGWPVLAGVGAALIMPAIVALVAPDFACSGRVPMGWSLRRERSGGGRAADRWPVHRLPSWRYVFAGKVLIVLIILAFTRYIAEPRQSRAGHRRCQDSLPHRHPRCASDTRGTLHPAAMCHRRRDALPGRWSPHGRTLPAARCPPPRLAHGHPPRPLAPHDHLHISQKSAFGSGRGDHSCSAWRSVTRAVRCR
jgi:hypothetical protein